VTKGRSIIILTLLAALTLLSATQQWVSVRLPDAGVQQELLSVPGTKAAPAVTALAVVAMAAAIAAAIAKKVGRYICLAVVVLAMAGVSALGFYVAAQPAAAAATMIAEKIGLSGHGVGAISTATAWPYVGAVLAALAALFGVYTLLRSRSWVTTARYTTQGSSAHDEAERRRREEYDSSKGRRTIDTRQAKSIDDWDDLSRGDDPTA
jgi:uncharacterized membrane protein (TIGR02234 family)